MYDKSFYPMLGVGLFYIMFWVGFVAGHNVGLTCDGMLLSGLASGVAGGCAIVKLERLSKGKRALTPRPEKNRLTSKPKVASRPVLNSLSS